MLGLALVCCLVAHADGAVHCSPWEASGGTYWWVYVNGEQLLNSKLPHYDAIRMLMHGHE